ncbi:hypothetical protein MAP00_006687 [Monascus purpureus]|nr:hypothetical protein MAP00_006687 [Monascus purpureus]
MGGEAKNPRFSMPRAVRSVGLRVFGFFMLIIVFITLLVPENDHRLLGASGMNASPLVIALNDAGINVVPDILNAAFLIIAATGGLEPLYIASRVLRHMALAGQMPKPLARVDSRGRPTWALLVTAVFTIAFTYINCSNTGAVVFTWFSSISSTIFMVVWVIIPICSFRFHAAIRAQNSDILKGRYAYRAWLWPLAPVFLGVIAFLVLVGLFAASLYPVDGAPLSAYSFFETYLGVPIVLAAFLGFKIVFRTRFRRASEIDLVSGHVPLSLENEEFLDRYYSQPMWRRVWSYVSAS